MALFFSIKGVVGGGEELFNGLAIVRVDGNAGTYRDGRLVTVGSETLSNSIGNPLSSWGFRFRENEGEFIASVTRRSVNGAGMNAENVRQAADGVGSHEMAIGVIDNFQPVQIEQHDGKRPPGAVVAPDFRVEGVEKSAVVGKAGERIGDRQLAHVFICAIVFGDFSCQGHGGDGHDADERLQ
jgi:hypothetical protein